ncbi:MAG: zinc ABC transporter solute-binding protein [Leptolinea sp.]|nr:zinc ABC transporter solute-binding protein [Leptolinea sp.]
MRKVFIIFPVLAFGIATFMAGCQVKSNESSTSPEATGIKVTAAESFIADIAQNVAGDRFVVDTLIPLGMDLHAFEPIPSDMARLAESDVVIINGGGLEGWLEDVIANSGGDFRVIEASAGLQSRDPNHGHEEQGENETHEGQEEENEEGHHHGDIDPHFWLDPINTIQYVENIRFGLIEADPEGKDIYTKNAENYIHQLTELDAFIRQQVETIPVEKRLIVTNHENFGYFADRYGFEVVGTIIPSVNTGSSPSAQQLARLIDDIRDTGVSAIFLETGINRQMAEQVSAETNIKVVTDLYSHTLTEAGGEAPTYIDMMKYNTRRIVENLK